MLERTWKDTALDLLLAVLVVTSLFLSLRVWSTPAELLSPPPNAPSVQPQPPALDRQMPEILRPEMILVKPQPPVAEAGEAAAPQGTTMASLHAGAVPYRQAWPRIRAVLTGFRPSGGGAFQVDQIPDRLRQGAWVQLQLPTSMVLHEWVDHWQWNIPFLRNGSIRVDRVTFYLSEPGAIYLSNPAGQTLYLSDLSEADRNELAAVIKGLDPALFVPYRPLETKELYVRVQPDLLVPVMDAMPKAQARILFPDERHEEARYFPDLSVVRQIDEKEARSLTDGQRLLRFTSTGMLEYRTADISDATFAPDRQRALAMTQEWVGSRGGWPQELVLRRFVQQPGRARFEFDYRSGGPFPVESVGSAVQVHVSAQRVVYFSRYPAFVETLFSPEKQPIITPEAAIQRARDQVMGLLTEQVRSVHPAYMVRPVPGDRWELEPAWVIQAGDIRVYVPAVVGREKSPVAVR
ncbi:MAG: hypothetical protein ACOY93_12825 [Bacillota bacterium]